MVGINTIEYKNDTIISGNSLQKYSREGYRILENRDGELDTLIWNLGNFYLLPSSDTVQISLDGITFDILYQFDAPPETIWSIEIRDDDLSGYMDFRVLDTFRVELNGHSLSAQSILICSYLEEPFQRVDCFSDTVYQQIGSKYNYIIPWDRAHPFQSGEGGVLRCFQNENLGLIEMDLPQWIRLSYYDYECSNEVLSAVKNISDKHIDFNIFPNPTKELIYIERKDSSNLPISVQLINSIGNEIFQFNYLVGEGLDVSNLPSGIYFVVINSKYHSKIIIM